MAALAKALLQPVALLWLALLDSAGWMYYRSKDWIQLDALPEK